MEARFAECFGRAYTGPVEAVNCDDAEVVLVTLGSVAGLARESIARLREQGKRVGLLRIRYIRPFPAKLIAEALAGAAAVGVLEKDISFGAEGTVFTNVNSALQQAGAWCRRSTSSAASAVTTSRVLRWTPCLTRYSIAWASEGAMILPPGGAATMPLPARELGSAV